MFSFFFWYFPVILLDCPVNSDVFFTFVLFLLAVPCVSYFFVFVPFILLHSLSLAMKHGCCCICSCCMSCFVLPFFSLFLCFLFLRAVLGRGVAVKKEESSLNIKKLEGDWGGGRSASPPDALGVVAFVRVAFLVLFFSFYS